MPARLACTRCTTGQDDGSVQVDETRVNGLLAERMQAKMRRDFGTADQIQSELQAMGVEVYDKERTWTAGGGGRGYGGSYGGAPGGAFSETIVRH